jgi:glycosyltransferase involved in cell wall biosynthesis
MPAHRRHEEDRSRETPSVSVVIPTYNCAHLLPNAVRSAFRQTIAPSQVIVVDDGCTDDTVEVMDALAKEFPRRLLFIRQPNGGEASARNRGVAAATGEYIAFLDSDDVWLSQKFQRQLPLFQHPSAPALTFTAYTRVSGTDRTVVRVEGWQATAEHALRRLMDGCLITPSTVIVRRDALTAAGPFDESLRLGVDWEMWLRLAAAGHRFAYLPEPMTDYLWHADNISRDQRKISGAALTIFPRLFDSGALPPELQRMEGHCLARWYLNQASYALDAGERTESRRSLLQAVRRRPASVRAGWLLLALKSLLPQRRTAELDGLRQR